MHKNIILCIVILIINIVFATKKLKNQLLVISFDGLGANKLDEFVKDNPNSAFASIIKEGVKAEYMQPSYPTVTYSNHYTLVTGINKNCIKIILILEFF